MPTGCYERDERYREIMSKAMTGVPRKPYRKYRQTILCPEEFMKTLIVDSPTHRRTIKPRLLRYGLLKNECYECGLKPEWNGKKLVLILDHKNGINNDNRLENLRMLCPNCNSQTPTFCRTREANIALCIHV